MKINLSFIVLIITWLINFEKIIAKYEEYIYNSDTYKLNDAFSFIVGIYYDESLDCSNKKMVFYRVGIAIHQRFIISAGVSYRKNFSIEKLRIVPGFAKVGAEIYDRYLEKNCEIKVFNTWKPLNKTCVQVELLGTYSSMFNGNFTLNVAKCIKRNVDLIFLLYPYFSVDDAPMMDKTSLPINICLLNSFQKLENATIKASFTIKQDGLEGKASYGSPLLYFVPEKSWFSIVGILTGIKQKKNKRLYTFSSIISNYEWMTTTVKEVCKYKFFPTNCHK